ncbi:MAG: PEP/pyruvate-binding domain-containing protein [Candidatus Omnitrophota bacterium]
MRKTNDKKMFKGKGARLLFKQAVSLITASVFLCLSCQYSFSISAIEAPAEVFRVDSFELPEYLGEVRDRWQAPDTARGIVIHIQDAHCDYNSQHRIAEIIGFVTSGYGPMPVNLEGGEGEYFLDVFEDIPDMRAREKVADYFVREGLLNGGEFFAVNEPGKAELWGIEDGMLYVGNLEIYRRSLEQKPEADKAIAGLAGILNKLKEKLYTPGMREFSAERNLYRDEKKELKEYFLYLSARAAEYGIGLGDYPDLLSLGKTLEMEKDINFKQADNERRKLIQVFRDGFSRQELSELLRNTALFREGKLSVPGYNRYLFRKAGESRIDAQKEFPELNKYFVYISEYEKARARKCLEEINSLEGRISACLASTEEEKRLYSLDKHLEYMKKLSELGLVKKEYEYFRRNREQFRASVYSDFIGEYGTAADRMNIPDDIGMLDGYQDDMLSFYEYSFLRDEAFIRNARIGVSRTPAERLSPALMVTGGFHTENLLALFKKNGISYVSIIPKFEIRKGTVNPYFKILAGERTPFLSSIEKALFTKGAVAGDSAGLKQAAVTKRNSAMQIASLLNVLGIVMDARDSELFRIGVQALAYAEELNGAFALKTTEPDEYIVFRNTDAGAECYAAALSDSEVAQQGLAVVNRDMPVKRDDPVQVLWAFAQAGHDTVVSDPRNHMYITTADSGLVTVMREYLKRVKGVEIRERLEKEMFYLLENSRKLRDGFEKPSMVSVVKGLIGPRAGGQGIYIPLTDEYGNELNTEQQARAFLHELTAGVYGRAGHGAVKAFEGAVIDGKGDIGAAEDLLGQPYFEPVWRVDSAVTRMGMERDYSLDDGKEIDSKLWALLDKINKAEKKVKSAGTASAPVMGKIISETGLFGKEIDSYAGVKDTITNVKAKGGYSYAKKWAPAGALDPVVTVSEKNGEKIPHPSYFPRSIIKGTRTNVEGDELRMYPDRELFSILGREEEPLPEIEREASFIFFSRPGGYVNEEKVKKIREQIEAYKLLLDANFAALALIDQKLTPESLNSIIDAVEKMVLNYEKLTSDFPKYLFGTGNFRERFNEFEKLRHKGYTETDLEKPEIRKMITDITEPGSVHRFINDLHTRSTEPLFTLSEDANISLSLSTLNKRFNVIDCGSRPVVGDNQVRSELLKILLSSVDEWRKREVEGKVVLSDDIMIMSIRLGEHSAEMQVNLAEADEGGGILLRYKDVDLTKEKLGLRMKFLKGVLKKYGFDFTTPSADLLNLSFNKDSGMKSALDIREKLPVLLKLLYNLNNVDINIKGDDAVDAAVNIFYETLRMLPDQEVSRSDVPPSVALTEDRREALNSYLKSLKLEPVPDSEPLLTQRVIDRYINIPVSEAMERGQLVPGLDGIRFNAFYSSSARDIIRDLLKHDDGKTRAGSVKMAELASSVSRNIMFRDTGITGSLLARTGTYLTEQGKAYVITALCDPKTGNLVFARAAEKKNDNSFTPVTPEAFAEDIKAKGVDPARINRILSQTISDKEIAGAMMSLLREWPEAESGTGDLMIQGLSASPGVSGVYEVTLDKGAVKEGAGNILLVPYTTPEDTALFDDLPAIVTAGGGVLSHASIMARERHIPAVILSNAREITVSGEIAWEIITYSPFETKVEKGITFSDGLKRVPVVIKRGDKIMVDGDKGLVIIARGGREADLFIPEHGARVTEGEAAGVFTKAEIVKGKENAPGIIPLEGPHEADMVFIAGGKGDNLRRVSALSGKTGFKVPPGMFVTSRAFSDFVERAGIEDKITAVIARHTRGDGITIAEVSGEIERLFQEAARTEAKKALETEIENFLAASPALADIKWWAVRSSNIAEDSGEASFAGAGETYLFVKRSELADMVIRNFATFATERALKYRLSKNLNELKISQPVVIQAMIDSEISGVVFTGDPRVTEGGKDKIVINASHGLGEAVVSGRVQPDQYIVDKFSGDEMEHALIGSKRVKMIQRKEGGTVYVSNPPGQRADRALDREMVKKLSEASKIIEESYRRPVDIEFGFVGGDLYILQARPVTTGINTLAERFVREADINKALICYLDSADFYERDILPRSVFSQVTDVKRISYVAEKIRKIYEILFLSGLADGMSGVDEFLDVGVNEQYFDKMQDMITIVSLCDNDEEAARALMEYVGSGVLVGAGSSLIGKINGKAPDKIRIKDDGGDVISVNGIEIKKTGKKFSGEEMVKNILSLMGAGSMDDIKNVPEFKSDGGELNEEGVFIEKILEFTRGAEIVPIEDRFDIKGCVSTSAGGSVIYLSEQLTVEPFAVIHEMAEGFGKDIFSGIFAKYTALNSHTLTRGCGQKVRDALRKAFDLGSMKDPRNVSPDRIDELILEFGAERRLTPAERALIQYNMDNGATGLDILYGIQDRINAGANRALTAKIKQMNQRMTADLVMDIKQGFTDVIICPVVFGMESNMQKVENDCGRKFERNYGSGTEIETYDFEAEDRVARIIRLVKSEQDKYSAPEYNDRYVRIMIYLSAEDKEKFDAKLKASPGLVPDPERISFLVDQIPEDCMYDEAKLIVVSKGLLNYARLTEDFKMDPSSLTDLQGRLLRGVSSMLPDPGVMDKLKDAESIDNFFKDILRGIQSLRLTKIDYETIKDWAEAQAAISRSL